MNAKPQPDSKPPTPPAGTTPPPFAIRSQRTASGLPSASLPPVNPPPTPATPPAAPPAPAPSRSPLLPIFAVVGIAGAAVGAYLLFAGQKPSEPTTGSQAAPAITPPAAQSGTGQATPPVTQVIPPVAQAAPSSTTQKPKENETSVRALRVETESLFALAKEGEQTPERLALLSKASALLAESKARAQAGAFDEASRQLLEARQAAGQAAFTTASAKLESALAAITLPNGRDYFENDWKRIDEVRAQAARLIEAGEPGAALEYMRSVQKTAVELRGRIVTRLLEQGREAAAAKDTGLALFAYVGVNQLEPGQTEALAYLYRNRFKAGELLKDATTGLNFRYAPPGTFQQGSPNDEPGRDRDEVQHAVTLTRGFFLSETEVTQAAWDAVMGPGSAASILAAAGSKLAGPRLPMHSIAHAQAVEFCRRLSETTGVAHRLPIEAEWEYAARAGTTTAYANGASMLRSNEARIDDPTQDVNGPAPAGTSSKANAWGLLDVHGNVLEWTADWSAPYATGPVSDPQGPTEAAAGRVDLAMRVVRGGSWQDDALKARSANRMEQSPVVASEAVGFRVAREVGSFAMK